MNHAEPLRARFQPGIIAEFIPARTNKVVIFCDGLPAVPRQVALLRYFARRGFWAFHMRYRGTWESDGIFLQQRPDKDVEHVVHGICAGFRDVCSGKRFRIAKPEFFVAGSSFGGTAAIFASLNPKVKRAGALAPVSDWPRQNHRSPLRTLRRLIEQAFGSVYRLRNKQWDKLKSDRKSVV